MGVKVLRHKEGAKGYSWNLFIDFWQLCYTIGILIFKKVLHSLPFVVNYNSLCDASLLEGRSDLGWCENNLLMGDGMICLTPYTNPGDGLRHI